MATKLQVLAACGVIIASLASHADADDEKGDGGNATLDSIKTGRLARNGITAGVALAVQLPRNTAVHGLGTGAMPYIEALPLLWRLPKITRAYCVARHTASNAQAVADQVAFEQSDLEIGGLEKIEELGDGDVTSILRWSDATLVRVIGILEKALAPGARTPRGVEERYRMTKDLEDLRRASGGLSIAEFELIRQTLKGTRNAEVAPAREPPAAAEAAFQAFAAMFADDVSSPPRIGPANLLMMLGHIDLTQLGDARAAAIRTISASLGASAAGALSRAQFKALDPESKKVIVSGFVKSRSGWTLGLPGAHCWTAAIGVYAGVPTSFGMNVDFVAKNMAGEYEDVAARRPGELKPILSFGITVSPIAEVRFKAGATLSNAILKEDGPSTRVWTWTFALGGNFDIAGALLGK